jgi:hypothetical protein
MLTLPPPRGTRAQYWNAVGAAALSCASWPEAVRAMIAPVAEAGRATRAWKAVRARGGM